MFSEGEAEFVRAQPLLRLATVAADGQPDADAVGFEWDGRQFVIGGHQLMRSRKFKNVAGGNRKVSLILDDLASVQPWRPRGIKIHGIATPVERAGRFGPGHYLIIQPLVSWSWGIEGESFQNGRFRPHKVIWPAPALTEEL